VDYQIVKNLLDSPGGKELKDFFLEELDNVRHIEILGGESPDAIAVHAKAQLMAYTYLKHVMGKIMEIETATAPKVKDDKDKFFSL
jgi:hypothetical protein